MWPKAATPTGRSTLPLLRIRPRPSFENPFAQDEAGVTLRHSRFQRVLCLPFEAAASQGGRAPCDRSIPAAGDMKNGFRSRSHAFDFPTFIDPTAVDRGEVVGAGYGVALLDQVEACAAAFGLCFSLFRCAQVQVPVPGEGGLRAAQGGEGGEK